MWGNESEKDDLNTDEENLFISYSASDRHDLTAKGNTNIKLSADNTSVTGPRFAKPSTVAGVPATTPTTSGIRLPYRY